MRRSYLRLFGDVVFSPAGGGDVAMRGERRDQLLAYLACRARWVNREELADLFWSERSSAGARGNLRFVVLNIRRGGFEGFEATGSALRWSVPTDVQDFESAIVSRQWNTAVQHYSGNLLHGFELGASPAFANWLLFERARRVALWNDAVAAQLEASASDPEECVAVARVALRHDPLNETAIAALITAELALGRRAEAQRCWRTYVGQLADHHGIEPSAELRAIASHLEGTRGVAIKAPRPPEADCIGRRSERSQLLRLLDQPNCRVLTVIGPGGVGKSTLARALLPGLRDRFGDLVFWIALDDLSDAGAVASRLAMQVGASVGVNDAPLEKAAEHLGERPGLLLLDNAEHLQDLPVIAEALLGECPQLKLLVTSRARTTVRGEWLLPLEGLPAPDLDEKDVEVLRAFDSVQLFEVRASALSPTFNLAKQAHDVVELIHAVEGLPLALEICAGLSRLLPVREVLVELRRSLDVLEGAQPDASARDRSLRASFEHSWRMLTPVEREILSRLGVFVSGFSRSAAFDIAKIGLPVLSSLVDKSLLRADGNGRFSLHPLLKQFALERLEDRAAVVTRHADHYAQLMAGVYLGGDPRSRMDEVEREWPNCAAAWHASLDAGLMHNIDKMVRALGPLFEQRSSLYQGLELAELALSRIRLTDRSSRRAYAMVQGLLAKIRIRRGLLAEARDVAREALGHFIALRDRREIASCLSTLGVCFDLMGDREEARRCYERGLRRARADGSEAEARRLEGNLALAEHSLGRYERALALYQSALARCERWHVSRIHLLNNIGDLFLDEERPAAALPYFKDALQVCRELNAPHFEPYIRNSLAGTLLKLGQLQEAEDSASEALELARDNGILQAEVDSTLTLASIATTRGDCCLAIDRCAQASRLVQSSGYSNGQCSALSEYAAVLKALGHRVRAATVWTVLLSDSRAEAVQRTRAAAAIEALTLTNEEEQLARASAMTSSLEKVLAEIIVEGGR